MKTKSWYVANNSNDAQGLVVDEDTGENIAVTYKAENAPILAAAPELLDALKACHDYLIGVGTLSLIEVDRMSAQAIAKAEGES